MRLSVFVGILAVAGGVTMGKLLHDREVAQNLTATPPTPDPSVRIKPTPAPGQTTAPTPAASARPTSGKLPPLTMAELAALDEPRRLMAEGRFDEARRAAYPSNNGSPSLRAAQTVLKERATLYGSLTSAIHRHPFVNAPDLVEVTLPNDVTYTARVLTESDEMLSLSLADGRQIDVHQERVLKRVRLSADAWMAKKKAELEKEIAGLDEAGSLEIFHVAFEAFETGFSEIGVGLLEKSLAYPGGGAVVDVYGTGDIELLHRAQERLRADKGYPSGGSEVALVHRAKPPRLSSPPPAPVTPEPTATSASPPTAPTPPVAPAPEPELDPEPPPSATDMDRLQRDTNWSQANATYNKAVAVYRESFAGNTPDQKAGIRQAADLLTQAQRLLDKLPQDMGDANSTIDTFVAKVNSLLRDVKKRKMATGS